jgi:hypothetical protein
VNAETVGLRCRLHAGLTAEAREAIQDGILDEGHCAAVLGVTQDVLALDPWLTTSQAKAELVAEVLGKHRGSSPHAPRACNRRGRG